MPAAPADHVWQGEARELHRGDEVEGDDRVDVVLQGVDEGSPDADAGVVDEDVDGADVLDERRPGLLQLVAVGEIGGRDGDRSTQLFAQRGERVGGTGDEPKARPLRRGGGRDRASDPRDAPVTTTVAPSQRIP